MDKPLSPAADDDNDGNKTSPQLPTRRQQQLPEVEEEDKSTMKPKAVVPSNQQQWQLPQTIPKKEETQPEKGKLVNASLSSIGVHAFKVPSLSTPRLGRAITPGAVAVGGTTEEVTTEESEEDYLVPTPVQAVEEDPSRQTIEAHLVPDDAEIEARITQRVENQITRQVEERLLSDVVVVTAIKEGTPSSSSSRICGFERTTFILFVTFFVLIMVGGIVAAVLLTRPEDDTKSKETLTNSPTSTPTLPIEDLLLDELRSWIVPTQDDLIPFYDPDSVQSQALEWLRSDPIAMSKK